MHLDLNLLAGSSGHSWLSSSLVAGIFDINVKQTIENVIQSTGYLSYLIIWFVIFAESGLFFGFFLPGDSLLITTGFLCFTNPSLDISVMCFGCFVAAVIGDNVGYYTGRHYGRRLFEKEDSKIFKKKYLLAAQEFYDKKGAIAIVLARFLAIVRTFAPIIAGAAAMNYRVFITYNIIGGLLWAVGLNLLGYFFGQKLEDLVGKDNVEKYLVLATLGVMLLSFIPSIIHLIQSRQNKQGH
jgi:membrane-associated protein